MREIFRLLFCCGLIATVAAGRADAQYRNYTPAQATTMGESYHIEISGDLWKPSPTLTVASEQLGIVGTSIDAVNDLGFTKTRFKEVRLIFRPGKKHKLRFDYIPIKFSADGVALKRDVVFNGIKYAVNLPVNSSLDWKAYHLGYEYDFLYHERWYVGFILEAKYTDVDVKLQNPVDSEYASVAAPIPTLGGVVRLYPMNGLSLTGEFTGFKLPTDVDSKHRYDGKYLDFNVYLTWNVTNNFGAQVGYRSMTVDYRAEEDTGNFKLKGLYFGGVARF